MITTKSIRKGFANNSSSSHSIIFVTQEVFELLDQNSNAPEYGWDEFVIKTRKEKERYLFVNFITALQHYIKIYTNLISYDQTDKIKKDTCISFLKENRGILGFEFFDEFLEEFENSGSYDMYVDHQSVWDIPTDNNGKINAEFYGEFCREILNNNYVILGGNDNGEPHEYKKYDIGVKEIINTITNNTPW